MNVFEEVHNIAALAKKIERSDEARSYEDEPYTPRLRAKTLKQNSIYSEADLEKYNDDKERAESIRDNSRGLG